MRVLLTLVFSLLISVNVSFAQVSIAPTNLFMSNQERFGTYMVINGSAQNQEISIEFLFGYNISDSTGQQEWVFTDSARAEQYSIAEYVRAFPQNFILPPGQRQIVRLRVNAPNSIPDGTYWARIKTNAVPETPPVEISSEEGVAANVSLIVEQVTGLFYKKGNVSTGIEVEQIRSEMVDSSQIHILTDLNRTGNSPFVGSVTTTLLDQRGNVVKEGFSMTSIYFDGTYRQTFNISDLDPGNYRVQVKFESQRMDIEASDLVNMETVTSTGRITIPQR